MSDKVALITPSFNRAYIIGETAASIFAQTHENWEWVIVDDGSTDESWELIQSYAEKDPRVKGFQRNRGPKGACTCRNIAVEKTNADWLIFLDTDDLLHPDCLKQRLAAAQSAKENEVLYFPILVFEKSIQECRLWDDLDHPTKWLEGVLTMRPPVQGSGTFWPRYLWDSHGQWREDLRVWQDIELHARAHWNGVKFNPATEAFPDFYLRVSPDSLSRVGFHSKEKLESRLLVIEECWARIQQHGASESERKAMAAMTLSAIRNGANLSLFDTMNAMLSNPQFVLSTEESALAHLILRYRKWKLDRIPQLRRQIQRKWTQCFPPNSRKLGTQSWIQKTT
ncbi:glycosyltransferase family 2 protein [Flavobacteriales bacterium]|nr:glycosyltransferase family 2 protein [Flavobacteriales bacterium]